MATVLNMAHRNSWFTVLKNGDFPVRKLFTSLPEGILDLLNGCFYGDGGIMNPSKFVFFGDQHRSRDMQRHRHWENHHGFNSKLLTSPEGSHGFLLWVVSVASDSSPSCQLLHPYPSGVSPSHPWHCHVGAKHHPQMVGLRHWVYHISVIHDCYAV